MSLAAGVEGSNPALHIGIFLPFVIITLVIVVRVSKRATSGASDFYTAGGGFTGPQNGIAISGDYLSAASFLGIAGAIALYGYDGFLYSIGFLGGWLGPLPVVARALQLRRLPVLDRLPRGVAGRAAAGRRAPAQHRPLHDGRRAGLPHA